MAPEVRMVKNGPGKWDAMLNLFEEERHQMLTFTVDNGTKYGMRRHVNIYSIEKAGPERWIIKGTTLDNVPVMINFCFRTRLGTLQIIGE